MSNIKTTSVVSFFILFFFFVQLFVCFEPFFHTCESAKITKLQQCRKYIEYGNDNSYSE